jgi:murein tripeptide amidase MpaA
MLAMASEIRFDTYYPYAELTAILQNLALEYPHLLSLESIGKSYEGRDVYCMTVTNRATGSAEEKPALWCDGNIHATEVSASSACLHLIYTLVTRYETDTEIRRAVDTRTFYIVPRVNPDGAEQYFQTPPHYIRSSTRPYPFDEEPIDGLKRQDLDGDGRTLTMRIPDHNGPWKIDPEHPRLMVRRDPLESGGQYYRLLPEGLLENWDGVTLNIQRNKEGLDLNRNFPAHWRQESEQYGAGPYPGSEPEAQNLMRFITSHPNITGSMSFHTYSGVLLRPYGTTADDTMPAEDLWTYQTIGEKGTELTGYPAISVYHDFRYHPKEVITGVFDDWIYDHLGIFAWTVEIWSPQRQAGLTEGFDAKTKSGGYKFIDWYRKHATADDVKMLEWSDTTLEGKGYIDWYPFEHPQLGKIELGGWHGLYAFRNPPPQFLEKEIAPLSEWAVYHALLAPELALHSLTATRLTEGTYRVRVVVENVGWLPTYVTQKAVEKKAVRGIVAEIALAEGAVLEMGEVRVVGGQMEGRAYKSPAPYDWDFDPTEDRAKVDWIVRAVAGTPVSVEVRHARAGVVRGKVILE